MRNGVAKDGGPLGSLKGLSKGPSMAEIAQNDQYFDFLLCFPFHYFLNSEFAVKILSYNVGEQ